jgi:hypothetical protein
MSADIRVVLGTSKMLQRIPMLVAENNVIKPKYPSRIQERTIKNTSTKTRIHGLFKRCAFTQNLEKERRIKAEKEAEKRNVKIVVNTEVLKNPR